MKDFIYLDHNATTPVDPGAAADMQYIVTEEFGNPSSGYVLGTRAKQRVEQAREEVAGLIHAGAEEIVHLRGESRTQRHVASEAPGMHITSAVEHPAIQTLPFFS
jgi:cysteine desulfurase